MLDIILLSQRDDVQQSLETICAEALSETCSIQKFSSGQEAADRFKRQDPDLTVIAAELPDMDGLRLISELRMRGHRCRFILLLERSPGWLKTVSLAYEAGVLEYVFFPFQREEAVCTLLRVSGTILARDTHLQLAQSIRALRNSFMERFLDLDSFSSSTLRALNSRYHMNLSEGIFQVVILSFPGLTDKPEDGRYQMMLDNIVEDARVLLDPVCFEMVPFVRSQNMIVLVSNYATSRQIDQQLRGLLDIVKRNIRLYCTFQLPFVIGVGSPERDSIYMKRAFRTAQYALRCQLLMGRNQLFLYPDYTFDSVPEDDAISESAYGELSKYTQTLDAKGVSYAIYKAMSTLTRNTDPAVISKRCGRISLTVVSTLGKIMQQEPVGWLSDIDRFLDTETSLAGLKTSISGWAQGLIEACLDMENRVMLRTMREAKQFIDQNYSKHLTLQNVAEKIGLSPAYFCTVFKQEVGLSFSSYLTEVRMENAKRLLAQTDMDITAVSSMVGYQDPRYFSRVFAKNVGTKPTQYRKQQRRRT